jgi:hypothetical protein
LCVSRSFSRSSSTLAARCWLACRRAKAEAQHWAGLAARGAGRLAASWPGRRTRCSSSKASASGAPALTSPVPATCASRHTGDELVQLCASSKHGGARVGASAGLCSAGVTSSPVRRSTSCLSSSFSSAICELACNRLCSTAFCCRRRCRASLASPASSGALSRCPPLSESAFKTKKEARRQHCLCTASSQSKSAMLCSGLQAKPRTLRGAHATRARGRACALRAADVPQRGCGLADALPRLLRKLPQVHAVEHARHRAPSGTQGPSRLRRWCLQMPDGVGIITLLIYPAQVKGYLTLVLEEAAKAHTTPVLLQV